jgi:FkbM family methyltransferase
MPTPGLKKSAQAFLRRIGLYQRLKSSRVYDFYWAFTDRQLLDDRTKEVEFYKKTLQGFKKGDLIFDVGANEGYKTDIFLRLGAKVVAVDPDEANQKVLRQRFLRHRLAPKMVSIEVKAVSDNNAIKTMWIDAPGSAKNTLDPKWVETLRNDSSRFGCRLDFARKKEVETTTLENLMTTHGVPFFVKIDVEGHEPSVLRGLHRPVPYLSFEVNLPEFKMEGLQCISILNEIAPKGEFNCAIDCRRGLMFERWMSPREFARVFDQCNETCIEVFWKTGFRN